MKDNPKPNKTSTAFFLLCLLLIMLSFIQFVRGEIINPTKGLYLFDTHARIVSAIGIFILSGMGPFPFIKKIRNISNTSGNLLILGIILSGLVVIISAPHYSVGRAFLISALSALLFSLPGLIHYALVAEAKRQQLINQNAEQAGAGYPPQGVGSPDP